MKRLPIAFLLAVAVAASGQAQTPDRRGEIALTAPTYQGVTATAPIPPEMHVRNEGGSDGAGLCVISSILANGQYQHVPDLEGAKDSLLWRTAKSRPGGYSPSKLEQLVSETMPNEKWAEYVGRDPSVLDTLSRKGYPIGATMNTGALYGYRPIHHMVSLIEYRNNGLACVVDNNDPGKYHWMPASEFARRWIDGGTGWAWIWTRLPAPTLATAVGGVSLIFAAVVLLIASHRVRWLAPAVVLALAFTGTAHAQTAPCRSGQCPTPVLSAPTPPPTPTMAWHNVTINGQPARVWGWLDGSGYVRYWPQAQPRPQPQPRKKPPVQNYGINLEGLHQPRMEGLRTNDATFRPEIGTPPPTPTIAQTCPGPDCPTSDPTGATTDLSTTAPVCAGILACGLILALVWRRSQP